MAERDKTSTVTGEELRHTRATDSQRVVSLPKVVTNDSDIGIPVTWRILANFKLEVIAGSWTWEFLTFLRRPKLYGWTRTAKATSY